MGQLGLFVTWSYSSPLLLAQVSWLLKLLQELLDGVFPQSLSVPAGSSTDTSHSPCWKLGLMHAGWELPWLLERSERREYLLPISSSSPRHFLLCGSRSSSRGSLM